MSSAKEFIVVAEDSAPNRTILVHLLRKLGFDVIECSDGESALSELNKAVAGGKNVVAILSDIMMPKMDGLVFLEHVRKEEKLKSIPFVLVTAVSDKEHIVKAKSMNVNGYILKPVTFQRVTTKLEELLPGKKFPKLAG
jgi:two-component system chemotaxis response regulator CheY